jgi:hypothetical protein
MEENKNTYIKDTRDKVIQSIEPKLRTVRAEDYPLITEIKYPKRGIRAKVMLPAIQQLIAIRAGIYPYTTENGHIITDRYVIAEKLINEIKEHFPSQVPPSVETIVHKVSAFRHQNLSELDEPWDTSMLSSEPLSSEVIPWLMGMQYYRKCYGSKPLTVREAKWFGRLFGFRDTWDLQKIEMDFKISQQLIRNVFLPHVIATWAQLYAYREKIDTIAGIKITSYSLMDNHIASGELKEIYDYNNKWLFDSIDETVNRDDVSKKDIEDFDAKYLLPSLVDQIRFQEIQILAYSLGEPDMSHKSIALYSHALTTLLADNLELRDRVQKLPQVKKVRFLVLLREEVKDNPNTPLVNFDKGFIECFINIVEKEVKNG